MTEMEEDFLECVAEFLRVFLEEHIGRVFLVQGFPAMEFITLFADFTVKVPSPNIVQQCFQAWGCLIDYLVDYDEAGGVKGQGVLFVIEQNSPTLSAVAKAFLDRVLFITCSDLLSQLDNESRTDDGDDPQGTPFALEATDGEDSGLDPTSDLEVYLDDGTNIVRSFLRFPVCQGPIFEAVMKYCKEIYAMLQKSQGSLEEVSSNRKDDI